MFDISIENSTRKSLDAQHQGFFIGCKGGRDHS